MSCIVSFFSPCFTFYFCRCQDLVFWFLCFIFNNVSQCQFVFCLSISIQYACTNLLLSNISLAVIDIKGQVVLFVWDFPSCMWFTTYSPYYPLYQCAVSPAIFGYIVLLYMQSSTCLSNQFSFSFQTIV